MFELIELLADLHELRELGLSEEEVNGYIELFLENYDSLFYNAEIV